jgi:hypothetical protein
MFPNFLAFSTMVETFQKKKFMEKFFVCVDEYLIKMHGYLELKREDTSIFGANI